MSPVIRYLLGVGAPYLLRVALYYGVFKFRAISCSFTGCLVIGGSFILVGLLPFPPFLQIVAMIGASLVLITRYTDVEFPDVLIISSGVELVSIVTMDYLLLPLII